MFTLVCVGDGEAPEPVTVAQAEELFAATVRFWRRWQSWSRYRGRWREMVHRCRAQLKLLTFAPTGAIVAAPRRACPRARRRTNWDYRYVWIRDAAFCVYALLRLGFSAEAEAFMRIPERSCRRRRDRTDRPMQVMYGIDGRATSRTELSTSRLSGSTPGPRRQRRRGQLQLDIYGALIDSVYLYDKWRQPISSDRWDALCALVDWVCEQLGPARRGHLGDPRRAQTLRLLAADVLGGDRAGHADGQPPRLARRLERWRQARDAIYRADHGARLVDPKRRHSSSTTTSDVLDASVLMMPLAKFISPTDPSGCRTLDALSEDLVVRLPGLPVRPAGQPGRPGRARRVPSRSALSGTSRLSTRAGRLDEARLAFEKMLTYANHLGLYAEEIGRTGEQFGNSRRRSPTWR